ncbi:ABC transporter substrate-binding protein [Phreatobacter sp. AB_2022a]|uniref:ABC transporter substrate-binding protein n=1 Tax=Phreatobacter sp. AB_2022a TaxID=3003134 RepID=UPI002286FA09|nr:ABC transporter substrate-binding protein [Phreatobacter sp. AB_2022a]MCZ0737635.1 ABC transporter substrate-binding protein [Phreatobacter sp. AB_2022a]
MSKLSTTRRGANALLLGTALGAFLPARLSHAAPQSGGTLTITTTPEPAIITNALSSAPTTAELATKIFDGLLEYDMNLKPQPSLAESWTITPDGKTITFRLRQDVVWHDGKPFTSADVQFALMEVVKKYHPRGQGNLGPVASIDTPDAHTAVFNLAHPYPPLMMGLSSLESPIVPRHIYEGTDFRNNPAVNNPIGTGPFKFTRWEKGNFIQLDKNERYWRPGRPYLDRLIVRFIADSATRAAAVERSEIDVATFGTINPVEMRRLETLPHLAIAKGGYEAIAPVMMLELNTRRPPFDDKRVRLAVAYALDRNFITRAIWHGFGRPAVGPISSFMKGSGAFTDQNILRFDVKDRLDIANRLLDEAGLKRGANGMRVKIVHDPAPFGEDWRRMGEYIKQALGRVGIEVELRNRDYPSFVRQVHNEYDFDMTSTWSIGMADPTLGVQRQTWSKTINRNVPFGNVSQYANPEVDALWEAAQTENDPAKRNRIFHKLQELLVADSPIIWLMEMDLVAVQNKRVQDLITSPLGLRGGLYDTWIKR